MHLENEQKRATNFYCKFCDYTTSRKNNWLRHLTTRKHKMALECTRKEIHNTPLHICSECGKKYKHLCSLYRHKKMCKKKCQTEQHYQLSNYELEQKCKSLENEIVRLKATTHTQIIQYNNININVFLEKHYRGAMNLTEFVNKIKLSIDDLIYTRKNGYINGVSKILMTNLDKLDKKKRPIQYIETDSVFYVKEENKWAEDQGNIDKGINSINKKQIQKVQSIMHNNIKHTDLYVEMVKEVTNGNSQMDNEKIKKNLEKNTLLIK
uniref:C2H2-type domain-containing protein n=1 Tax=Megaviridae environmental sample TaxID=1737588 RepID=A0A5J6VLA2_9VIRU|nr:MAG: hypothetical protein [Megaviridae environmental sample]